MKVIRNGKEVTLTPEEIAESEAKHEASRLAFLEQELENEAKREIAKDLSIEDRLELIEEILLDVIVPGAGSKERITDFVDRVGLIRGFLSEARSAASEDRPADFSSLPRPTRGNRNQ